MAGEREEDRFCGVARLAGLAAFLLALGGCALPEHYVRSHNALPDFTNEPGEWTEQLVPMRDGVRMHTRILLPRGATHAPVVLMRTPYDALQPILDLQCRVYARYGLGCVVQEVRGRMQSEGEWVPLSHERADGEDTLAWLDAQPWADSIALWGVSYLAGTALAPAHHLPKKVKTMVLTVFGTKLRSATGERGLFHHELLTAWAAYMPTRAPADDVPRHYHEMLRTRPHLEADARVLGLQLPFYRAWVTAPGPDDAVWTSEMTKDFETVPEDVKVPVLYLEGFDDPFLVAGLDTFERLGSRDQSVLALLPVNHTGTQSGDERVNVDGLSHYSWRLTMPWLLHHLTGAPLPFEVGVVKSWPRGADAPSVRPTWPGPTKEQRLLLTPSAVEGGACAQRELAAEAHGEANLTYRYDPARPWHAEGGARGLAYLIADGARAGPVQQTWDCRPDVLRFTAAPVTAPTRLLGRMRLELNVASSAPDTAFIAKLVDVDASGRAVHVTDGAATLHWPTAEARQPVPYSPGEARRVQLDFWPTEWVLRPGHRLGLWLSSSDAPFFSVHLNTATPWYQTEVFHVAEQQVRLGGDAPSALVLQVE